MGLRGDPACVKLPVRASARAGWPGRAVIARRGSIPPLQPSTAPRCRASAGNSCRSARCGAHPVRRG